MAQTYEITTTLSHAEELGVPWVRTYSAGNMTVEAVTVAHDQPPGEIREGLQIEEAWLSMLRRMEHCPEKPEPGAEIRTEVDSDRLVVTIRGMVFEWDYSTVTGLVTNQERPEYTITWAEHNCLMAGLWAFLKLLP